MRRIAVIPARGGSKRLPGKNIVDFEGRPIIAYTIDAARDSGLFERLVVSTEDDEIAAVSKGCGAEVEIRPVELASGSAHLSDVLIDLFDRELAAGRDYDQFCMVHATAPLRRAEDIAAVVGLLEEGVCHFAIALTEYNLPAFQALKLGEDGLLTPMWPECVSAQSHGFPPLRCGNGSTYAAFIGAFREQRSFFGQPLRGHLMERMRSIDIDAAEDLEIAKLYKRYLDGKSRGHPSTASQRRHRSLGLK